LGKKWGGVHGGCRSPGKGRFMVAIARRWFD
jgi:hypothetical protein